MSGHFCIVPSCKNEGRHVLTLRMRRPDTSSVWAPSTGAYLCDEHATSGMDVDIVMRPNRKKRVRTTTIAEYRGEVSREHVREAEITQGPRRREP